MVYPIVFKGWDNIILVGGYTDGAPLMPDIPPPLAPILSHGLCRHFHMGVWCDIGDIRCTIDVIFIGTFLCSIIWFFVLIGCCVACCAASKKKKAELV